MSNFQSLLSTFQSATGVKPSGTKLKNGNGSVNESFGGENNKRISATSTDSTKKEKSLLTLTTDLWRWSQIRQSLKSDQHKNEENLNRPIRLGICLCIVDRLPHGVIWKDWIENAGPSDHTATSDDTHPRNVSAELYIHAKHPERVRDEWARSKMLPFSHCPNWNDVRVVKAMLSLAATALEDSETTHVIFGTESCLPIAPLQHVDLEHGKSYVAFYGKDRCTRFDEHNVWNVVQQYVPIDAIHKALPGWCVLSRQAAEDILKMPKRQLESKELWAAFQECWAPEEVFFPTALALVGHLLDPARTVCKSLTYAEWDTTARNHDDRAHPKEWDYKFGDALVQQLRRDHGCILLRKMTRPLSVSVWKRAIRMNSTLTKRGRENEGDGYKEDTFAKRLKH